MRISIHGTPTAGMGRTRLHTERESYTLQYTSNTAPDGSWKVDPRRLVVAAPGVRVLGLHPPRGGVVGDQGIHPPQNHVPADLVVQPEIVHADGEGRTPDRQINMRKICPYVV